ncbi:MAG TPA: hypothetical protein VKA58_07355 [Propionibacteriaceae bacterium]|nr:hypothetical protein [Propionibacteriaceae bacterium]
MAAPVRIRPRDEGGQLDVAARWGKRKTMVAKAGERAEKTGDFYCESCDAKVHVTKGDKIPKCPNGHRQFGSRRNEP